MKRSLVLILTAATLLTSTLPLSAQLPTPTTSTTSAPAKTTATVTKTEQKALDYLLQQQDQDGAWMPMAGPSITALVIKGMIQGGKSIDDPAVKKGLLFIEKFRQEDGGYYKDANPNYNTSIVLSLFAILPREQYQERIAKAQAYLKAVQSIEGRKDKDGKDITPNHPWYGGAGYSTKRPDLSNTSFFIEALHDSGIPANDPAIQKALIFVSRCQMNSETNDQPFAKGQSSGGMVYSTDKGGESMFGKETDREGDEVLVAYGSMTYAGLKSFIYAGLEKDDPRVKQAMKWISQNWTLDVNPGTSSDMGIYYFYHTFAKALRAYGEPEVTDARGVKHNWAKELETKLATLQKEDGSFANKNPRWMENLPVLSTSYVVLALQEARK